MAGDTIRRPGGARMPSLGFLEGFEAAARHASFTRAAEEMHLTQSALSRQIQTLEDELGTRLFVRRHRSIELTAAGRVLYETAVVTLDALARAAERIRQDAKARPLVVSTTIAFASLWLLPRLPQFRARHPGTDVFLSANNRIIDLEREGIDLAIRYCPEAAAPPDAPRLFGERLQVVCAPALLRDRTRPLKKPADLARHALLHFSDEQGRYPWLDWSVWLAANGVPDLVPAASMRFNQYDLMIQAAVEGQGIALGRSPLVERYLADRHLASPFPAMAESSRAYFALRSARAHDRPDVDAFVEWLAAEAATTRDAAAPVPARKRERAKPLRGQPPPSSAPATHAARSGTTR